MNPKLLILGFMLITCVVNAGVPARNIANEIQNTNRVTTSTARDISTRGTSTRNQTQDTKSRVSASRSQNVITRGQNTTSRNIAERTTSTRNTATVVSRTATTGVKARNSAEKSSGTNVARTAANVKQAASRATTNTVAARTAVAKIPTATKSTINTKSVRTATNTNAAPSRARTTTTSLMETLNTKAALQQTCLAQYTDCMDNYCNVLDENLGRCACSKNITNYKKTSDALKEANTALQDVAQQIQYIGLNKVQIETLFAETEAEMTMGSGSDSSKIKSSLDKIKDMVIDIKTPTTSSNAQSSTLDLSGLLDFSSDGTFGDIMSLFGGNDNATNSISNQRGATLYNTAANRCKKTVLDTCKAQGVDIALITNAYDMTIDKDCLTYEAHLTEQNDEMLATIRNATNVLQRARLSVAANKNSYDLRGCIGALETCITDEYLCGNDYEYCLDAGGTYIVGGEIVLGSTIGDFNEQGIKDLLTEKIAEEKDDKAFGPCAEALNLCQDYTYKDGKYTANNRVISEYLSRVVPQIKKHHDEVIAEFRTDCISDTIECVTENNRYSTNDNISDSAVKACKSLITTCMSALGETGNQKSWVAKLMDKNAIACTSSGGTWDETSNTCTCSGDLTQSDDKISCINKQSLCTGSGGDWNGSTCECMDNNATLKDNKCVCNNGYTNQNNICVDNKQINCENSKGTWTDSECICTDNYEQSDDKLTCKQASVTPGINNTPSQGGNAGTIDPEDPGIPEGGTTDPENPEIPGGDTTDPEDPEIPGGDTTDPEDPETPEGGTTAPDKVDSSILNPQEVFGEDTTITVESAYRVGEEYVAIVQDAESNMCYAIVSEDQEFPQEGCVVNCDRTNITTDVCSEENTVTLVSGSGGAATYSLRNRNVGITFVFDGEYVDSWTVALENGKLPTSLFRYLANFTTGTDQVIHSFIGDDNTAYFDNEGKRTSQNGNIPNLKVRLTHFSVAECDYTLGGTWDQNSEDIPYCKTRDNTKHYYAGTNQEDRQAYCDNKSMLFSYRIFDQTLRGIWCYCPNENYTYTYDSEKPWQNPCNLTNVEHKCEATGSFGEWDNGYKVCRCNLSGTVYSNETGGCVCDTNRGFTGTIDSNNGCTCPDGTELTNGYCKKPIAEGEEACTETGGTWTKDGCQCNKPGTILTSDNKCKCDGSKHFSTSVTPDAINGCTICSSDDFYLSADGSECIRNDEDRKEYCVARDGSWNDDTKTCECTLTGSKLVTYSDGTSGCTCDTDKNFEYLFSINGCTCKDGMMLNETGDACVEIYTDDSTNKQSCESTGGIWGKCNYADGSYSYSKYLDRDTCTEDGGVFEAYCWCYSGATQSPQNPYACVCDDRYGYYGTAPNCKSYNDMKDLCNRTGGTYTGTCSDAQYASHYYCEINGGTWTESCSCNDEGMTGTYDEIDGCTCKNGYTEAAGGCLRSDLYTNCVESGGSPTGSSCECRVKFPVDDPRNILYILKTETNQCYIFGDYNESTGYYDPTDGFVEYCEYKGYAGGTTDKGIEYCVATDQQASYVKVPHDDLIDVYNEAIEKYGTINEAEPAYFIWDNVEALCRENFSTMQYSKHANTYACNCYYDKANHLSGIFNPKSGKCGCMDTFADYPVETTDRYGNPIYMCNCAANQELFSGRLLGAEAQSYSDGGVRKALIRQYGQQTNFDNYVGKTVDLPLAITRYIGHPEIILDDVYQSHANTDLDDRFYKQIIDAKDEEGNKITTPCDLILNGLETGYTCAEKCSNHQLNACKKSGGTWSESTQSCLCPETKTYNENGICNCDYRFYLYAHAAGANVPYTCKCPEGLQKMRKTDMQYSWHAWGIPNYKPHIDNDDDHDPSWDGYEKCVLPGTFVVSENPLGNGECISKCIQTYGMDTPGYGTCADKCHRDTYIACDAEHGFLQHQIGTTHYDWRANGWSRVFNGSYTEYWEKLQHIVLDQNLLSASQCKCIEGTTMVYDDQMEKYVCIPCTKITTEDVPETQGFSIRKVTCVENESLDEKKQNYSVCRANGGNFEQCACGDGYKLVYDEQAQLKVCAKDEGGYNFCRDQYHQGSQYYEKMYKSYFECKDTTL